MKIGIINCGVGNIGSITNAIKSTDLNNVNINIITNDSSLLDYELVILPGVGSFDSAMQQLEQSDMLPSIEKLVLDQGVPFLGICVGMQLLARSSDEGKLSGLGWVDANVRKFDKTLMPEGTCLPHMGWNDVEPLGDTILFKGLENDARFYFLHSYYMYTWYMFVSCP